MLPLLSIVHKFENAIYEGIPNDAFELAIYQLFVFGTAGVGESPVVQS